MDSSIGGITPGTGTPMPPGRQGGLSKFLPARRTFRSLTNPVFRLYFFGTLCSMGSMNMQMIARSLLIWRLTESGTILGLMFLAHAGPTLALSLFGGVIADRLQKKYVMIIGQSCSAIISFGIAICLTTGYLSTEIAGSWWVLVVASVFQGIIMALMMPSRQAYVPEIVGGEELMNAIALNSMGMNLLRLFAPAAAGFLIDAVGFEAVYYVTTGTYVLSVVFITFLPLTSKTPVRRVSAIANIKEGIKYLRGETTILFVLGFSLIIAVLSMPFQMLMPVFTETVFDVGARGYGVLMSVSGAGAMAGSLVLASLPNKKRGLMLLVSGVFLGVALMAFSFSEIWALSIFLVIFVGIGQQGHMTLSMTLIQYYVEDEYRGRVMSIMMMQFGLVSFGAFIGGMLTDAFGIQWAIGGFAMVLSLLSVLALLFIKRIRNLD
ncbi:MFS transporter [Chloroflexota bacterium]